MNKSPLILIILTAGLCSCSTDDGKLQDTPAPVRKITVEITENPLTAQGDKSAVNTRGSVIGTSSLSAYSMNYQDSKYSLTKNGASWVTTYPFNHVKDPGAFGQWLKTILPGR